MIVRTSSSTFTLLFAWQGSILPKVLPRICSVAVLSLVAVLIERRFPDVFAGLPVTPFTLLGLSLSIFMSFKNNACYGRWWEARQQLGQMLVDTRSLARQLCAVLPDDTEAVRRLLDLAIAFTYALKARLRKQDEASAARPFLPPARFELIACRRNITDAILAELGRELAALMQAGRLSPQTHQLIETQVVGLSGIQAACERILSTPLPFAYSLLLHRTAILFCLLLPFGLVGSFGWWTPLAAAIVAYTFFGLDALGDELEEPFGYDQNDLPLDALARLVEIDLLDATGVPAPEQLGPRNYLLT